MCAPDFGAFWKEFSMLNKKTKLIIGLIALIGAILWTIPGWGQIRDVANQNFPELNDYLEEYEDGMLPEGFVRVTVDANLGSYASLGDENSSKADYYYYIVWLDDSSFISLKTTPSSADSLDAIAENTWAYVDGQMDYEEAVSKSYSFIGEIGEMDSEERRFFRSSIAEFGIDEEQNIVRYQEIQETEPDVFSIIVQKYLINIIIAVWGLWMVVANARKLSKERKMFQDMESSVQDYNRQEIVRKQKVVSGKEALARITDPRLAKKAKKTRRGYVVSLALLIACVLAEAGLYGYHKLAVPSGEAAKVYDMDNADDYAQVGKNNVGEVTIDYTPVLVYSPSGSSYGDYVIFGENGIYLAELDDSEYDKAMEELKEYGETTLHGYYRVPGDKFIENAVNYYNSYSENGWSESDYDKIFGKYGLYVEDSYKGNGMSKDDFETYTVLLLFPIFFLLLAVWTYYADYNNFRNSLRYLSDNEYSQLERDMNSPETKEISKFLYLTDRYIVSLHAGSNIIAYADVLWAYNKVNTQYSREVSYEIQVMDKSRRTHSLPVIVASPQNKQLVNDVLAFIHDKNPNARIGYTEANIKATNTNVG